MQEPSFLKLFKTSEPNRDNFLSRLFGMFAEEPVRIWCRCADSPYLDLGRPTIKRPGEIRGQTVDFALKSKATGEICIAELKCELAFENYGYLVLTSVAQVNRHVKERKEAFLRLIDCARNPQAYSYSIKVKNKPNPIKVAGSVLVWGSVTAEGREAVMAEYGFADVLSVEDIIRYLLQTKNLEYQEFVERRHRWCGELFGTLLGG